MHRLADRRTLARYATVAAIVLVVGGLFVRQQFFSGGTTNGPESTGMLAAGEPALDAAAPDFALRTADGQLIRLSDLRGKTVVLNFWATWCPPCREEIPALQQAYAARQSAGDLVVLGVDFQETADVVSTYLANAGVTYPVVIDDDGSVTTRYGLPGLPGTFFIDRNGVVRKENLGPVLGSVLPDGIAAADAAGSGAS
jgi:cytochrome c biogenesis protein CcmG/thiol:disulfide interchange protein DsbE